jgi:hypothetical protein
MDREVFMNPIEINEKIAEDIFGWRKQKSPLGDAWMWADERGILPELCKQFEDGLEYEFTPPFSTSISAAWMVADKIRTLGKFISYVHFVNSLNGLVTLPEHLAARGICEPALEFHNAYKIEQLR